MPYCKIGAKSDGNNRPGPLVRALTETGTHNLINVINATQVEYQVL
jgi:hypothetical protein